MSDATTDEGTLARANGIELFHQCFGDRANPPLVLVMGLGTQMLGWDEGFCRLLADRGYYVVRFDNRDIGKSTWFDHEEVPSIAAVFLKARIGLKPKVPYTLKDMAADTIGLMDALGLARAHVVGASMGGMIGQEIAMGWPDRLLTFTSIMSSTGDPKLPGPTEDATALMMAPAPTDEAAFVAYYGRLLRVLRAGEFPDDEATDADRARAAWARGYHPAGTARQFAAIVASGDRTKRLRAVAVPTLVIHGRVDPLVPVDAGIATADAIPGAKLVLLERMGHAFPRAVWGEVVDAIAAHAR